MSVPEEQDDQLIAVVFKRSIAVAITVSLIAGIVWLVRGELSSTSAPVNERTLIQPQPTDFGKRAAPPSVQFTDITSESGINHRHVNGARGERMLPETMGGGVAVLDFNNDQNDDLLFVNGRAWPWQDDSSSVSSTSSLILYKGNGEGKFDDVTAEMGLNSSLYGMGVAVGDYDNDGDVDLFVTAVGHNKLFENQQGERFVEVSNSGIGGDEDAWSTGAAFFDYDRDGDLDLMVLNYVRWSREIDLQANYQLTGIGRAYGPPAQFAGTNSYLYRNEGDGSFVDVSKEAGIEVSNPTTGLPEGKGLALIATDVDEDGWVDVIVANDMVRNYLFMNNEGRNFVELGIENGVAFDNTGSATGAMGIDDAYIGQSYEKTVAIGNFGNEMTSLYVQPESSNLFTDQAIVSGIGPASRRAVTFGVFFFDYDLDGRLDLLQANGHIENEINVVEPGQEYAQKPQLFWNCGFDCARQFITVPFADGNGMNQAIVGRGAAYADFDNDGDLDIVLTQIQGQPVLLRNDVDLQNNWVQFDLIDRHGAPALGAMIDIETKQGRQRRTLQVSRSYLSQVSASLTFGLGKEKEIETAKITWPNGDQTVLHSLEINQKHRIQFSPAP